MMLRFIVISALVLAACRIQESTAAFSSSLPSTLTQREQADVHSYSDSPRANDNSLRMSNLFDDIGKFFREMGAGDDDKNSQNENDDDSDDDDEEYAGATRLLTIPAKSIKPGGLRLLLMFYCMSMQNTPFRGSWKADQPTRDEYIVDMYFHDQTAVLTITLSDTQITIDRIGSAPSMSYLTQESIIVDGILDELQVCVTQDDVNDEDRLLQLPESSQDAIEKARESLAFS